MLLSRSPVCTILFIYDSYLYSLIALSSGPQILIGCSGWSYSDSYEAGGWVGSFYPDTKTKKLPYYSQFFRTTEMDSSFYEKFYSHMTKSTFYSMVKATPEDFQFSIKVPETITHIKRMDVKKEALSVFQEFLDKISPLKNSNKLGAVLFQLSPSFSLAEFKQVEGFLDKLPCGYEYALEFRHPSWETEGALELLRHYNIATVITDSPDPNLQYLSNVAITANHAFIRLHGRTKGFWYNYKYTKEELQPWVSKVREIKKDPEAKILRIYFNNHYGAKAVSNALEFKEMLGEKLSAKQKQAKEHIDRVLRSSKDQLKLDATT